MSAGRRVAKDELRALLGCVDVVALAEELGAESMTRDGSRRYRCRCLWHDERTESLVLYPDQASYHCYGCGAHGDAIQLVADRMDLPWLDAVRFLAERTGYWPAGLPDASGEERAKCVPVAKPLPRVKEDKRLEWDVITPVPDKVPAPSVGQFTMFVHRVQRQVPASAIWIYRDGAGQILGLDARYEYAAAEKTWKIGDLAVMLDGSKAEVEEIGEDGAPIIAGQIYPPGQLLRWRKDVVTWTWNRNRTTADEQWRARTWSTPCPLYGLDRAAANPEAVLLFGEGCKAADAANSIPGRVGMTWRGGVDAAPSFERNDWSVVAGRHTEIWADADAVGIRAAWFVAAHHLRAGAASVRLIDVSGLEKGWDLADDLNEPTIPERLAGSRLLDQATVDAALKALKAQEEKEPQAKPEPPASDEPPEPIEPPLPPGNDAPAADDDDEEDDEQLRNELADADRFVRDILGTAWYCAERARKGDEGSGWLVWDGKRLRPSEDGAIVRLAKATALSLSALYLLKAKNTERKLNAELNLEPADKDEVKKLRGRMARWLSKADQIQSKKRIETMIELAKIDERLLIGKGELDADPDLLNTQNGVLHLPTSQLLPHDPKYRCTRICAVPYHPDADRTHLTRLLDRACMVQGERGEWTTDRDRIRYLQDALGSALYGHQELQQFFLCIGNGRDGKGTLFEAILDALGGGHDGYAMKASTESFVRHKVSAPRIRDDIANLHGARIVLTAEINKGEALDGAMMKTIVGQDTQRVRHLFGKEFEFKPICTLFMQMNHEPYIDSADDALWHRLVRIPFGPTLQAHERDPAVRRALHDPETGGAALLAWLAEGARRTHQIRALTTTPSVELSTRQYRDEQNPLAGFFIEDLRFAPPQKAREAWLPQKIMRQAFEAWLQESGLDDQKGKGISGKRIGQQLRDCKAWPDTMRINGQTTKVWRGVTLRSDHPLFKEHADGSFVAAETDHLAQLSSTGAITVALPGVTALPHHLGEAHTREKQDPYACARANIESGPKLFSRDGKLLGDEVTRLQKENGTNETNKPSDPWVPDLDDGDPPF